MKVFVSWSGPRSRAVALALRDWLPSVLNAVKPFVSAEDIPAGDRWSGYIERQLQDSSFGLVCVTRANQAEPWLNFEAGALAKAVQENSHVAPIAIDLKPTEIKTPLALFQVTSVEEKQFKKLIRDMNTQLKEPLNHDLVGRNFDKWWPDLERDISAAVAGTESEPAPEARTEKELLEDVLLTVRRIERKESDVEGKSPFLLDPNVPGRQHLRAGTNRARRVLLGFMGRLQKSYPEADVMYSLTDNTIEMYAPGITKAEQAALFADADREGIHLFISEEAFDF